jgi:RimJ/RimL family protein N-acetyltransferase
MAIDERLVFYTGKHVRLKVLTQQDIHESNWVGWFNNEAMCEYNMHHYYPNTFEAQAKFLDGCITPQKIQLGIVDKAKNEVICGVVSLSNIDMLHRNCEIAGTMEVEYTRKNPALFLEAYSIMIRHGFEELGLHKIYGGTFRPHVAQALVRVFNFEIEGVRKKHIFKRNQFHDVINVGVFKDTINYPEF